MVLNFHWISYLCEFLISVDGGSFFSVIYLNIVPCALCSRFVVLFGRFPFAICIYLFGFECRWKILNFFKFNKFLNSCHPLVLAYRTFVRCLLNMVSVWHLYTKWIFCQFAKNFVTIKYRSGTKLKASSKSYLKIGSFESFDKTMSSQMGHCSGILSTDSKVEFQKSRKYPFVQCPLSHLSIIHWWVK